MTASLQRDVCEFLVGGLGGVVVGRASYGGVSLAAGREGHRMQIANLFAVCAGRKDRGYHG